MKKLNLLSIIGITCLSLGEISYANPTIFPNGISSSAPVVTSQGANLGTIGDTVTQAQGSVQKTDANQPNGYAKLDGNGNVTSPLLNNTRVGGSDTGTDISNALVNSAGTTDNVVNWLGKKVDVTGGTSTGQTLNSPNISGGAVNGTDISGADVTYTGANISVTNANALTRIGLYPDDFIETSDNGDDGLSINRASAQACAKKTDVRFESRTYNIVTTASPQCPGQHWIGEKWSEGYGAEGTWFQQASASSAISVSKNSFDLENIAFAQTQPAPSNTYPTAWQPTVYAPTIQVLGASGVTVRNIFLDGVYDGIFADGSGRLNLDGIYGQAFNHGIVIQHSLDSDTYRRIHFWPYWSGNANVLAYTENNLVSFLTGRVDTAFMEDMFTYAANVGLELSEDTSASPYSDTTGPTTKFRAHTISCDGTRYCLTTAGTGVTAQIDGINEQGQDFAASSGGGTVSVLEASQAIHIASGQTVLQIGDIQAQFIQQNVFGSTSTTGCSYVKTDSVFVDWKHSISSPFYVDAVKCDGTAAYNTFLFNTPPFGENSTGTIAAQSSNAGATVEWADVESR